MSEDECILEDGRVPDWCPAKTNRRITDLQVQELRGDISDLRESLDPAIEVWANLQAFAKILKWIGIAAVWIGKIGLAGGILFGAAVAIVKFVGKFWP